MAIKETKRLSQKGGFTEIKAIDEMLEEYKTDNSHTLSWIEDRRIIVNDLLKRPNDELHVEFSEWCKSSGIMSVTGKKQFFKQIREKYNFEDIWSERRDGNKLRKRYFVIRQE